MFVHIQPSSGLPIYLQIVRQVRSAIATRRLVQGAALPSVRQLAQQLAVNPLTVAKAYGELEREGLVESRRGSGTFVSRAANARRATLSRAARSERLDAEALALAFESRQLGIAETEAHAALDRAFARVGRGDTKDEEEA